MNTAPRLDTKTLVSLSTMKAPNAGNTLTKKPKGTRGKGLRPDKATYSRRVNAKARTVDAARVISNVLLSIAFGPEPYPELCVVEFIGTLRYKDSSKRFRIRSASGKRPVCNNPISGNNQTT